MVLDRGGRLVGSRGGTMPGPIALKLRDLRVQRGLTQQQAAELARVTPETLSDLESGKRPPYMPTLTKIARGYGVPIEELVEEE
jgi:transcriptional regulator with XRE-family HTH domain